MDKLAKSLFVFSLSVCDVVAFTLLSSAIVAIIYIMLTLFNAIFIMNYERPADNKQVQKEKTIVFND